jgi:adenylate cyclase
MSGKPIIIPDTSKNPDFDPSWDKKTGFVTKNMICFPIKNRNGVLKGVLQIINLNIDSFLASDMALAGACASLIGVAIENIESIAALQNLLMHK